MVVVIGVVCVISDSSLGLDSFEQFCVWQLLCAEGPDCSLVIPAIASLDTEGILYCYALALYTL